MQLHMSVHGIGNRVRYSEVFMDMINGTVVGVVSELSQGLLVLENKEILPHNVTSIFPNRPDVYGVHGLFVFSSCPPLVPINLLNGQ